MDNKNSPSSIFFDPWIDLDYFYSILPILPLIYEKIFIYYPSDRWLENSKHIPPTVRQKYRQEFLFWLDKKVIVPVVKGDYPFTQEIGPGRWEEDGPTDMFAAKLKSLRAISVDDWIVLEAYSTEKGRELAQEIIENSSEISQLQSALRVDIDPTTIPQLAYHYAGRTSAEIMGTLIETIGTYENDDWIRRENKLGEFLLPNSLAYQYRALQDLKNQQFDHGVQHNSTIALAAESFFARKGQQSSQLWPDREKAIKWRELGLHSLLRAFLIEEASSARLLSKDEEAKAVILGNELSKLREKLPVDVAKKLLEENLLVEILADLLGMAGGFATLGIPGAAIGTVVGHVGNKLISFAYDQIRWERLITLIGDHFSLSKKKRWQTFALGFGDVTVFGKK